MKKLLSLALCCALLLTGCASMLERSYTSETVHNRAPTAEGDSSILRAEDYQELVSGIYYFVSQGLTRGTIRLYNYTRDVESDLSAAYLEVVQEDPLGAYAVDYIKYDYSHIVSYYEAVVDITYRRTQEQISAIVSATGNSAIRAELQEALASFQPEAVLRISYFTEGTDIPQLLRQAYLATPAAAFGMPQAEVNIYPDHGSQRIVEVLLSYPLDSEEALVRSQTLLEQAQNLLTIHSVTAGPGDPRALAALLRAETNYDPQGSPTAYAALMEGAADSEGMALALGLLCQLSELKWSLVEGTLEGVPHCWVRLTLEEGERHLDPSAGITLYTQDQLPDLGYHWPEEPEQSSPENGQNIEENPN